MPEGEKAYECLFYFLPRRGECEDDYRLRVSFKSPLALRPKRWSRKSSIENTNMKLNKWITGRFLAAALALSASTAFANHPVLVEGEKDFDGDGLVGVAEDTDNATDRIFGTITAALATLNGGASQNGRVTIVTSGRFGEQVVITGTNGNVTVEAAPGVEANIDAVIAGSRSTEFSGDNNSRQAVPGIFVDAPNNRRVILRNLVVRNWSVGISILGRSHVTIDNCRIENNRDYGIRIMDQAKVAIDDTHVNATGFRVGTAPDNEANPGNGIEFEDQSSGMICHSTITGNFGAGIANGTRSARWVKLDDNCLFDNRPDLRFYPHYKSDSKRDDDKD